jgi:hypothetical protein
VVEGEGADLIRGYRAGVGGTGSQARGSSPFPHGISARSVVPPPGGLVI